MDDIAHSTNDIALIYNFLSENLNNIRSGEQKFKDFEKLTSETLANSANQSLKHILKTYGWTGVQFNDTFIVEDCWQALANLYISQQHVTGGTTSQTSEAEKILSFIPNMLLSHIRLHSTNSSDGMSSKSNSNFGANMGSSEFRGATMLADIEGFSEFASSMCLKGVKGLDDLHETTNVFLAHAVGIVHKFGGDVISFEGVALLCFFPEEVQASMPVTPHAPSPLTSTSLSPRSQLSCSCCVRALQCGLALRELSYRNMLTKVVVSYGEVRLTVLGGHDDDFCYLAHGACVSALTASMRCASARELLATKQFYSELTRHCSLIGATASQVSVTVDHTRLFQGSCAGTLLISGMSLPPDSLQLMTQGATTIRLAELLNTTSTEIINVAKLFVPAPVLAAICSDSLDRISELRHVTTLHMSFDHCPPEDPRQLQTVMSLVQETLHETGGCLRQFSVSEASCTVVAMWGVPSFSYASNCSRSMYCAINIARKAAQVSCSCSAGVATGMVFCGLIGSPMRTEYLVMGNDVTVAHTLMNRAAGHILVDSATYDHMSKSVRDCFLAWGDQNKEQTTSGRGGTTVSAAAQATGAPSVAAVWLYNGTMTPEASMVHDYRDVHKFKAATLRQHVRTALTGQLDKITNLTTKSFRHAKASSGDSMRSMSGRSAQFTVLAPSEVLHRGAIFTVILGSAGTGKSTAVKYFLQSAKRRNLECVSVQCRPGEEANPFSLVRKLFVEIVGVSNFLDETQQRAVMSNIIKQLPDCTDAAKENAKLSALRNLLGLRWPTRKGAGHPTAESENAVKPVKLLESDKSFYEVLCVLLKNRRTVIVIDDAHYCDELSWHQLHQVLLGDNLPLALLITSRTRCRGLENNKIMTSDINFGLAKAIFNTKKSSGSDALSSASSSFSSSFASSNRSWSDEAADGIFGQFGFKYFQNSSYLAIVANEYCVVIEMNALNEQEVGELLQHELGKNQVTQEVIASVFDFTAGNAFWCNAVAQYVKENGIEAFNSAIIRREGKHNSLNTLILSRFDMLTGEQQLVAKCASIIGDEFSVEMLTAVLPGKLESTITRSLEVLQNNSLIMAVDESATILSFQNQLIRSTLYELTPPSDTANVHLAVARFIETKYTSNIWDFYPLLSYHYRNSAGSRYLALKFTVKSANRAIRQGAYSEGFAFLQTALPLAVSRPELRALLYITSQAIKEMCPTGITGLLRKISFNKPDHTQHSMLHADYSQFRDDIERTLEFMSREKCIVETETEGTSTHDSANIGETFQSSQMVMENENGAFEWQSEKIKAEDPQQQSSLCLLS